MAADVIVVGAGVAGLTCARQLAARGAVVQVIDKARAVGGRCATRRFDGQPVDFGVLFFHGHEPGFLEAIDTVEAVEPLVGWPMRVHDSGTPCQPDAFAPYEKRVAFAEGVRAFPEHLARGLDVTLGLRVAALQSDGAELCARTEAGELLRARDLVLALPLEQSLALLAPLPDSEVKRSVESLLGMFSSQPCLTLIAGYPLDAAALPWDVSYPSGDSALLLISNETSKRGAPRHHTLVYQARPRWSRDHLDEEPATWTRALLDEAAVRLGPWAAAPTFTHPHRWRFGRIDQSTELASPLLLRLDQGARLGLAGDIFAAGGGVQASYSSGRRLAARLIEENGDE